MSVRRAVWWVLLLASLLPALTLTVLRLGAWEAGLAIRLVSFTPYAVVAYAVALVLLLVAARRRPAARVGALGVVAALVLHGSWLAPLVTGAPAAGGAGQAAADERVVVMSSNLLMGRADTAQVVRAAVDADVDLLVLQEVTGRALAGLDSAGLDELLPHRIGFPVTGERPFADTVGTMVFAREPLGEPRPLGTVLQSWEVEVDGVVLLAVHPSAPTDPDGWVRDHALLREAARESDADLVVGDLNATLDHAPLRRLVDDGYRDAVEESNSGWQPTWPANGLFVGLPGPLVQIDHVLTGPGLRAASARTLPVDGTDHRALLVEVLVEARRLSRS